MRWPDRATRRIGKATSTDRDRMVVKANGADLQASAVRDDGGECMERQSLTVVVLRLVL